MIVELIPFDEEGPFALGILAVAAGAGFLMYTTIAARMTEERPATQ
jgi:hypothetical protein